MARLDGIQIPCYCIYFDLVSYKGVDLVRANSENCRRLNLQQQKTTKADFFPNIPFLPTVPNNKRDIVMTLHFLYTRF